MKGSTFSLDPATEKNIENWLSGNLDMEIKKAILDLAEKNPHKLQEAFFSTLDFGTGGLRGIMGIGSNRVNRITVQLATLALAHYLKQSESTQNGYSVLIGYDSRNNSKEFAEAAAGILAQENIRALVFDKLHPAPLVSFGCRDKKCSAAIMITASHNPPIYNGYKVYWQDGGQVLPPHDLGIIKEMQKLSSSPIALPEAPIRPEWIDWIGSEIDASYLKAISTLQTYPETNRKYGSELHIVYTSLHGTGIVLMEQALKTWGMTQVSLVDEQIVPDGNFPTCKSPNPEEKTALELGIKKLEHIKGDILIATDPDADRVGTAVIHEGKVHLLTGNQIACLCLEHLLSGRNQEGLLKKSDAVIKTIVTTELFRKIAEYWEKPCFDVLTGFKYIAEKIRQWEEDGAHTFLFGGEESYGYLLGTYARDKDGIVSSCLIAETALHAKLKGKTLIDLLHDLYRRFGVHHEELFSLNFEDTKENKDAIKKAMEGLQKSPPKQFGGIDVACLEDYFSQKKIFFVNGKTENLDLPKSPVLRFILKTGTELIIRPSGTEPKVKIYCKVSKTPEEDIQKAEADAKQEASSLISSLKSIFNHEKK